MKKPEISENELKTGLSHDLELPDTLSTLAYDYIM